MNYLLRLVRHEVVHGLVCTRAAIEPVIVTDDHAAGRQPFIKECDAVVGRIVEIYINVDEGKDSLRNIRESLRDPAFVQMHSFELPKIPEIGRASCRERVCQYV